MFKTLFLNSRENSLSLDSSIFNSNFFSIRPYSFDFKFDIFISFGGINENKCDYNLQEATVAMTYAAGTGEYGPEASGKLAVGALAMGKVTETLGTCAVGLGWCPAGWIAGVGAAAAGL